MNVCRGKLGDATELDLTSVNIFKEFPELPEKRVKKAVANMYYCTISIIADQNGFISVVIGVYRYRTLQVVEDYVPHLLILSWISRDERRTHLLYLKMNDLSASLDLLAVASIRKVMGERGEDLKKRKENIFMQKKN